MMINSLLKAKMTAAAKVNQHHLIKAILLQLQLQNLIPSKATNVLNQKVDEEEDCVGSHHNAEDFVCLYDDEDVPCFIDNDVDNNGEKLFLGPNRHSSIVFHSVWHMIIYNPLSKLKHSSTIMQTDMM